jgi:hypothetical protein
MSSCAARRPIEGFGKKQKLKQLKQNQKTLEEALGLSVQARVRRELDTPGNRTMPPPCTDR